MDDINERQDDDERVALSRLEDLRSRIAERDRLIAALNAALERDLETLFERDQAA